MHSRAGANREFVESSALSESFISFELIEKFAASRHVTDLQKDLTLKHTANRLSGFAD